MVYEYLRDYLVLLNRRTNDLSSRILQRITILILLQRTRLRTRLTRGISYQILTRTPPDSGSVTGYLKPTFAV